MGTASDTKYQSLRESITNAIQAGEYCAGQRLPGERELASRFGVSYMTARRAVSDLVEAELLERRPGSGIYLRSRSAERLSATTINLIATPAEGSISKAFLRFGVQQAELRGWNSRITRMHNGYERPTVRAILEGDPALLLLDTMREWTLLNDTLRAAEGRVVLVANQLADQGVPSVVGDDRVGIRLACEMLVKAGHRNIAMVSTNPAHPVTHIQVETWRSSLAALGGDAAESAFIYADWEDFGDRIAPSYEAVRQALMSPDRKFTALICLQDEIALGALAACRECGCPVPDGMSLICCGDSTLMEYASPPVTVIDVDLEGHVKAAFELVEAALAGALTPEKRLRLITPRVVERKSVSTPSR
ncbi:MAG: LacI family DNA-binding transcriptional regulator [Capsulimonadaceae bacterium]|nr:LacI family DNA-binding transcriptional regulator [Capsulimonadaceae bacterium]